MLEQDTSRAPARRAGKNPWLGTIADRFTRFLTGASRALALPASIPIPLLILISAALLTSEPRMLAATKGLPFENEIRAFESTDRTNPPPKGAVLFVGSSTIRFWTNLTSSFPELTIIRRGFGGSRLPECLAYADRVILPYQPSKILIYEGDNDIARGDSPELVFQNFRALYDKIHGALPQAQLYFIGIKPSPSRWHLAPQALEANQKIQKFCALHRGLTYIDVWQPMLDTHGQPDPTFYRADKLHLTPGGYALWTKIIRARLHLPPLHP